VVIASGYALLLAGNRRAANGNLRWASLATIAAAAVSMGNWNVRPQTISFLLFALVAYLLGLEAAVRPEADSRPRSSQLLWGLPFVFALWANSHGGFVFGLALLGSSLLGLLLDWLRGQRRFPLHLLLIALLSVGGTLLTPLGIGMVDYVLGFVRHPVTRSLNVEFMPSTVRMPDGRLFFAFVSLWIACLMVGRYRVSLDEAIRLVLFGGLALLARRNAAWFGFVAAPSLAASLSLWESQRGKAARERAGRPRVNRAFAAVIGLLVLLSLPWFRPHLPLPQWRRTYVSPETPVQAVAFLRGLSRPRRVFHEQGYGSYMIWNSPTVPVFIDTRIELYTLEQWDDYFALSSARHDWQGILERYEVETLLLQRERQAPLIEAAEAASDWERLYQDEETVILQLQGEE
jgi:hypothetical protein